MKYFMPLFGTTIHEKIVQGFLPIDAHLYNTTIPTQTPLSSWENGTLTSPVLAQLLYWNDRCHNMFFRPVDG